MKRLLPICGPTVSIALLVWTSVFAGFASAADDVKIDPLDWPYWRGPEYNSVSRETGLPDTINPDGGEGSNLLWKRDDLGGRSTPIVLRGKLYTILRAEPGTPREGERVVCIDAVTGKDLWQSRHNVWSSDVPDTRVGWSSVVGDPITGSVYALGAAGLFQCFDGDTGEVLWSIPLHEEMGLLSTYGGRTNYPIVVDDMVILGSVITGWGDMATPSYRILGFDKRTGEIRYYISTNPRPTDTTYSAPSLATINGQKLLVVGTGNGHVFGFQPRTGKIVWNYELSRRGLNVAPTVVGDIVYSGHAEENPTGTKMGAVAAWRGDLSGNVNQSGELWRIPEMGVGKSAILHVDGRLYCCDDSGKIQVLDAKSGEPIGRRQSLGTINFASPVAADGKIYHCEKNGRWYILTPDEKDGVVRPKRGETMGNFPSGDECWASPVISHGKLYLLTTGALYCFEDKTKEHGATEQPERSAETPVAQDEKPAQLQVVPAEVLIKPGEKVQLSARLFNANGQFLKESPATFTVSGIGAVSENGEFTAPDDAAHQAAYVTAKVGDLTGRARVRVVPPLPWKFDFEGLKDAPVTWVGARYRHVLREVDGSNVMVKITTIPLGTRSRASLGPSDLHDYTIQTDFKAAESGGKLPDVGVIAQGYTLEISGQNKWIKLMSWIAHDKRHFKELPFELEPGVWYTLKLRAANQDGKAVLTGKIWKRGEEEPAQPSIELVDPVPNLRGAPGLFGNATNAELYLDNISVVPNSAG